MKLINKLMTLVISLGIPSKRVLTVLFLEIAFMGTGWLKWW